MVISGSYGIDNPLSIDDLPILKKGDFSIAMCRSLLEEELSRVPYASFQSWHIPLPIKY